MVVFPELEVLALALITCHLVEDTQIGGAFVRAEFLGYLCQESHLLLGQEFRALHRVEVVCEAIILDLGLQQGGSFGTDLNRLTKVFDLVFFKGSDQSTLVFVED